MGVFALALPGCRKGEEEKKSAFPTPEEYMNDPVFRKALSEKRKEREGRIVARTELVREMEQMVEAQKAKLPNADDAALKRALEADPKWNDLTKRVNAFTAEIEENGRKAQAIVRERLAPKKGISK